MTSHTAEPITTELQRWPLGDLDPCDGCNQPYRYVEPVQLDGRTVWLCRSCRELHR